MKKLSLLLPGILCFVLTYAQFSADSSKPLVVCNALNTQNNVSTITSGTDYYTFWTDLRSGTNTNVYGQHLDHLGIAKWDANGKAITNHPSKNILAYRITKWQSGFLLAYMTGSGDTLYCQYLDTTGNKVWNQPVPVAYVGNGFIYMDISAFNIFPNDSGAYIVHSYIYTGGGDGLSYNRIDFNGNLRWPVLSKTNPLYPGYNYRSISDGMNGFYALTKGNGVGSPMQIQRFDLQGNALWNTMPDITNGGNLNGFTGNISMVTDSKHNLYVAWDANGGRINLAKVRPDGSIGWASKLITLSDTSLYQPFRSSARIINDRIYVTWLETVEQGIGRSMVQQIDTAGTILWAAGGINAGIANPYDTHPMIAISDSGAIVNSYLGKNYNEGIRVQRIRSDGSLTWPNGISLASGYQNYPYNNDYNLTDDVTGCNAVFMASSGGDILAANVCAMGIATDINEASQTTSGISVYPNPSNGTIQVNTSTGTRLHLYDLTGRVVVEKTAMREMETLDISMLPPGVYVLKTSSDKAVKVVKE